MLKDKAYLSDILESARIIQQHVTGLSREQFLADQRAQDAVIRRFEIIGEAARRLSPDALKALPDVPWKLVVGMRNILIHDYEDVDPSRVWTSVRDDIPKLIQQIASHLETPSQ